jgi:Flp pilus assembly protein TadG
MIRRLLNTLRRRFHADERGVAAIEFALVVPAVVVIYLVGFEVAEAATVYRKLSDTTVQLANVSSQYTTMSQNDADNVLQASAQIMTPYPTSNLTIVLYEVTTDSNGNAFTTWHRAYQTNSYLADGTAVTTPSGFQAANTSYILVQSTYQYQPTIGAAFIGPIAMKSQIFMLPRSSPSIPYTG